MENLLTIFTSSGFFHLSWQMPVMWLIGFTLIYLAITRQYEPLLLLPIGFGILLANLPLAGLMAPGKDCCGGFIITESSGRSFHR